MSSFVLLTAIIIATFIFPMVIDSQFSNKYYCGAFEPVPIILNSIGLFAIIMANVNGEMLGLAIICTIVLYAISIFLVKKIAGELRCSTGDTVKMILANSLIPVSIILYILILFTAPNKKKKRKRVN